MKLNLGCGRNILSGYINADRYGGQITCDAQDLPFRDNIFNEVLMVYSLEHIPDMGKAIKEVHRVLAKGGIFTAIVPYGLRYLYDPYHYHAFSLLSMNRFIKQDSSLESAPLFHLKGREISDYNFPGKWHIHKYLPFLGFTSLQYDNRARFHLPICPRQEITFVLESA